MVRQRGDAIEVVADEARLTRLGEGEGVDRTRQLAPGAVARTIAVLGEYGRVARSLGATHVVAVGTSALRDATNTEEFLHAGEDALGAETLEQRIHRGLPRLRADVLPIGGTILIRVLHLGRCSEVRVSGGGVRVGLAQEILQAVSGLPNEVT